MPSLSIPPQRTYGRGWSRWGGIGPAGTPRSGSTRILFPANGPSADHIIAGLQDLRPGDAIPDGPPEAGCGFTVAHLDENRDLILHSEDHLPPAWKQRHGAWIDWTWAFVLDDLGNGPTRFIVRSRLRAGPWWVAAAYLLAVIPADFVMSRQMLHGVKTRVEQGGRANLPRPSMHRVSTGAQPRS